MTSPRSSCRSPDARGTPLPASRSRSAESRAALACRGLLPPEAGYLLARCEAVLARLRSDSGDVSTTAVVVIAAGLATIAALIIVAVKTKVFSFLNQIPSG